MKKLIRKGVFETNSSSSHSISLAGEDKQFIMDVIYPGQHGRIIIRGQDFGWEWEKFSDAETKLAYAFTDHVDPDMLKKVVMDQTGATEVIFIENDGHIDHESYGTASSICTNEENTRNFIFNKNSWLFTGNDNGTPDPTFYHVPEIRDGKQILPQYKFELSISGLKNTTKFLSYPTDDELIDGINALMAGVLMGENGYMFEQDSSNIYFQINRPRDLFEMSYSILQDYSKGYILMIKENRIYGLQSELDKDPKYKSSNRNEKYERLKEEVLKNDLIHRKLSFTISEI